MISTAAVQDRTVLAGEEDGEDKRQYLFDNSISVDIFYSSSDYRPLRENDETVERSVMLTASHHDGVQTVLKSLKEWKKPGGFEQKVYMNILTSPVREVVNQLVRQVRRFVQL